MYGSLESVSQKNSPFRRDSSAKCPHFAEHLMSFLCTNVRSHFAEEQSISQRTLCEMPLMSAKCHFAEHPLRNRVSSAKLHFYCEIPCFCEMKLRLCHFAEHPLRNRVFSAKWMVISGMSDFLGYLVEGFCGIWLFRSKTLHIFQLLSLLCVGLGF